MAILMISYRDLIQGLVSLATTLAVMGAALFLSAGTLQWPHGLAFLAAFFILVLVSIAWLWRVNPEIFAARRRVTGEGTKSWDKVLISILLVGFLATLIVAGLDGGRFHWAPAPPWAVTEGYVLLLLGWLGSGWAQAVNRHFEPSVRIQTDRDHHVITTGPYAFVRHPGYVSGALLAVGIALALGSLWALLPAALVGIVLIIRTNLEDATLQRELPGYAEYAARVRSKWVSGVW
jgi:protein-S-isoprenylcysteine O-methyltransferase Ste14